MAVTNQPLNHRFGAVAQSLHWLIAAMIVTQFVLANIAEDLPLGVHKLAVLARHKSVGMTILMLAVIRLIWRATHPAPPMPAAMPGYERKLANLSHVLLYTLLFAMPITGLLMSSAKGYSVSWFNWFAWPNLIGRSDAAFNFFKDTHHLLAKILFFTALLHVAAALKHHFWDKDNVLKRMLPFTHTEKSS
jgi:cytochrome b561